MKKSEEFLKEIGFEGYDIEEWGEGGYEGIDEAKIVELLDSYEKHLKSKAKSFTGVARDIELGGTKGTGFWTDGVLIHSDTEPHCFFRFVKGKKYRVTLEREVTIECDDPKEYEINSGNSDANCFELKTPPHSNTCIGCPYYKEV